MPLLQRTTNDSIELIYCQLQPFGCEEPFPPSQQHEHCTTDVHWKSLLACITVSRLAYQEAQEDRAVMRAFADEATTATQPILDTYGPFMNGLTDAAIGNNGFPISADYLSQNRVNSNSIYRMIKETFERKNAHPNNELQLRVLQAEVRANDSELDRLSNLLGQVRQPTTARQTADAISPSQSPQASSASQATPCCEELHRLMKGLSHSYPVSTDGLLVWHITQISQKINDAIYRREVYIDSPPFHTCMGGYQLRARFYPNGLNDRRYLDVQVYLETPMRRAFAGRITCILVDERQQPPWQHLTVSQDVTSDTVGLLVTFDRLVKKNSLHGAASNYISKDSIRLLVRVDQSADDKRANLDDNLRHALTESDR